jgi:hypothetical protein
MNTTPTTYTKSVTFIARNDYAAVVNGQEIGYAATSLQAQRLADDYVLAQIAHDTQCQAAEVALAVAPIATAIAPITRQQIAGALTTARQKVADNKKWFNALSKAAMELEASAWCWYGAAGVLKIQSRTTAGKWYTVTDAGCPCPAGQRGAACWHAAARRLLIRASAQPATAA